MGRLGIISSPFNSPFYPLHFYPNFSYGFFLLPFLGLWQTTQGLCVVRQLRTFVYLWFEFTMITKAEIAYITNLRFHFNEDGTVKGNQYKASIKDIAAYT